MLTEARSPQHKFVMLLSNIMFHVGSNLPVLFAEKMLCQSTLLTYQQFICHSVLLSFPRAFSS